MATTTPIPTLPSDITAQMRADAVRFDADKPPSEVLWRFDGHSNFDAAESAFVARQLEYMRPGIYMIAYPALKATNLIPWNTSVDTGASQYTVTAVDQAGEVKVSADLTTSVTMVDVSTTQKSTAIFHLTQGYGYSLQEARAAIYGRFPLVPMKAMRCREQMERKLDTIAFIGESVSGVKGLLTQSGTTTYTPPATGTGASKTWDTKSSDDVLLDLNGAPDKVVTDTKEIEIPDTMLLPLTSRTLIASRRVGDGTSSTILRFFLDNSPYVTTVEASFQNESNSAWTNKRGCVYKKDPTRLEMIVPQPFEQLPPQADGFMINTLCHARTAGVAVYLPLSIAYFDGI